MNPQRWERLKTVFADAMERETTRERTAFISDSCADDVTLRLEAESMKEDARTDDTATRVPAPQGNSRYSVTGTPAT